MITTLPDLIDKILKTKKSVRISARVIVIGLPVFYAECTLEKEDFIKMSANVNDSILNSILELSIAPSGSSIGYLGEYWTKESLRLPIMFRRKDVLGMYVSGIEGSDLRELK